MLSGAKLPHPTGYRCRCSTRSLTEAQARQRGWKGVTELLPQDGRENEGWDYNPAANMSHSETHRIIDRIGKATDRVLMGQDVALADLVEKKMRQCDAFDFAGKRKAKPVWCDGKGREFAESMLVAADNGVMKKAFDFIGQRPSLADLGSVAVTELTGVELGIGLTHKQLTVAASEMLRDIQRSNGLHNDDTGWMLGINKKARKKIGDNEAQSDAELRAVAGIKLLAKHAIVAERHADIEHNNPDVKAVLRLYAPVSIDGVLYRAKLTVKDYGTPKQLHALSAVEIENAPLGTLPAYSGAEALQQDQPTTGRKLSIADLLRGATLNDGVKKLEL